MRPAAGDYAELLREHVLEAEVAAAALPQPWQDEPIVETYDERERRRELAAEATREAMAWLGRGPREREPFSGPVAALRCIDDARIDGAPIRSTWVDPQWAGGGTGGVGKSDGDTAQRQSERVALAERAWLTCLGSGWTITTYPVPIALTAVQARAVTVMATLGIPAGLKSPVQYTGTERGETGKRKGQIAKRAPTYGKDDAGSSWSLTEGVPPDQVAAFVADVWRVELPTGHVVSLRVRGLAELYRALRERGQVPRSTRWESKMVDSIRAWDLSGWEQVASALGTTVRGAQRWAEKRKADHPMPLSVVNHGIVARSSELTRWMQEEFERGRRQQEP